MKKQTLATENTETQSGNNRREKAQAAQSKPQHTPGPWRSGGEFSTSQDEIQSDDGRAVAIVWTRRGPGGGPRPCFKDDPELKANARLIWSAPELLAALARLVESPDLNLQNLEGETIEAIQEARAALARAPYYK